MSTTDQHRGPVLTTAASPADAKPRPDETPSLFAEAVGSMASAQTRPEIGVGPIRPPQRLAPFSYALGLELRHPELELVPEHSDGDAFGRLILLYDPDGSSAWSGLLRLVAYIQADMDPAVATDPMISEVAWSWLDEALTTHDVDYTVLGGTVTATASQRFGDLGGSPAAYQLEMRASWTAATTDLAAHVEAFASVLAEAAGLPPEGVASLSDRRPQ